jgi:O-antigen/teichoic acid export membrane protein
MSYIAVLQVILVLGLETGCFKFASSGTTEQTLAEREERARPVFSTALSTVTTVSLFAFALICLFSRKLSVAMGYPGLHLMFIYVGAILALDSFTAILFAKLRMQQKAFKFAVIKSVKILSEFGFNLLLFFVVPKYFANHPNSLLGKLIPTEVHFSYIIFAVLLSCIVCFILFLPEIFKISLRLNKKLFKPMMAYSLPLMIAALPGIVNESADRWLFRAFVKEGYTGGGWRADLGVYQATAKLAVIMNLFIQMFRYAAEPFFFARHKEQGSKELYAKVMEYFVAFCMIIFLGIVFYVDIIALILGKDFRSALGIIPFILLSYLALGMLFNVSMWYKLSGQTKFAVTITLLGLVITLIGNLLFMRAFSYWASVIVHLASCITMLLYSTLLGQKYYPIPYRWREIGLYILTGVALYGVSLAIQHFIENRIAVIIINTIMLTLYLVMVAKRTNLHLLIKKKHSTQ